jgi:hypothetical protein
VTENPPFLGRLDEIDSIKGRYWLPPLVEVLNHCKKKGGQGVEKTKHTHTLSLSLSLSFLKLVLLQLVKVYIKEEIATIKKHRRSKFTQHILSLFASEFNSMLVELRFCFYYCCQQPKKVQQKKRDLEQCSRARHDAIRRDRQTDRKKKKG